MKDAKKGLRSCPIMLNAGRGAAEPGVRIPHPYKASSQRANIFVYKQLFAHPRGRQCNDFVYTGFGSLGVASPGVKHDWAASQPFSLF